MDADDAILLQRLTAGDRSAMDVLTGRYLDFVYSTARRRVGDVHLAQDIAQAVFLVLAAKAGRIGAKVVLVGWLYRTTAYVASNALKQRRRRDHHERAAASERSELAMPPETPADPDTLRQLDDAMLSLRSANRDAILLHYFQGRPLAEVAATLGITEAAARKRIARAVEQLRGILARQSRRSTASASNVAALLSAIPRETAPQSLYGMLGNSAAATPAIHALTHGVTLMMLSKQIGMAAGFAAILLVGGAAVFIANGGRDASRPTAAMPLSLPAKATPIETPDDGRLVATTPAGNVHLIAIGTATGAADDKWWTPAGKQRDQIFDHFEASVSPEAGKTMRAFVFSVATVDNENGPISSIIAAADAAEEAGLKTLDLTGRAVRVHLANVAEHQPTTVAVRLASGPWNLVASLAPETRTEAPGARLVSMLRARPRGTDARIRCDLSGDLRALAIDQAGEAHVMWPNQVRANVPAGEDDWNANFYSREIDPADVVEIRIERRVFDTLVEFSGVPTDPDMAANPVIRVSDATTRPAAK